MTPLDKFFQEFVGRAIDLNLFSRFVERLRFRPLTYRCVLHDALHHRIGHLAASAPIAAEPPAVTCGGAFGNLQKFGGELLSFVASAASARAAEPATCFSSPASQSLSCTSGGLRNCSFSHSSQFLGSLDRGTPGLVSRSGRGSIGPHCFWPRRTMSRLYTPEASAVHRLGRFASTCLVQGEIDRLNGGNLPCGR